jgi:2-O-methyltransferase
MLGKTPWILDVGSNDGGDSLRWLVQFREARVISFEPDKRAYQRLLARHASCEPSVRMRWYCLNCAVSDYDGETVLYESNGVNPNYQWYESGWDLSSSIQKPKHHLEDEWIEFKSSYNVCVRSLQNLKTINGLTKINLLWIDAQGADKLVLAGARSLWPRIDYIVCEVAERELYEGMATSGEMTELLASSFEPIFCSATDMVFSRIN